MMTDHRSARERTPFGNFELKRSHLVTGHCPYPPGSPEARQWASSRKRDLPEVGTVTAIPTDLRRAAALTLADRAIDSDDLRELLAMTGLDES